MLVRRHDGAAQTLHVGRGAFERDVVLEPPDDATQVRLPNEGDPGTLRALLLQKVERYHHLGRCVGADRIGEPTWSDPDDLVRRTVDGDRASQDVWSATVALPESVADDGDRSALFEALAGSERTSQDGPHCHLSVSRVAGGQSALRRGAYVV